jgi:hypothetical protein
MARKKMIETDALLSLIDEFYTLKCDREASLLKIPAIGEYIRSKGFTVQDYLLRRNDDVRNYIDKLHTTLEETHIKTVSVYRDIDIDAFLQKNCTTSKLRKALIEREYYYREITDSAAHSFKENKRLEQESRELKKQNNELSLELDEKSKAVSTFVSNNRLLTKENKVLREIINTYVYPEIANELLKKSGLIHETAGIVDENLVGETIVSAYTDVTKIKNKVVKELFDRI